MQLIRECSRQELINFYLNREKEKASNLEFNLGNLDWDDPNTIDAFLRRYGLKAGVISGFKKWDYAKLYRKDILECAIVNQIFPGKSQKLSDLVNTQEFRDWKPDRDTSWYSELSSGNSTRYPEKWALILRLALPSENGARWYVEDGSGRAICFLKRLVRDSDDHGFAYAYIGKEPDSKSDWLRRHLDGYFTKGFQQ